MGWQQQIIRKLNCSGCILNKCECSFRKNFTTLRGLLKTHKETDNARVICGPIRISNCRVPFFFCISRRGHVKLQLTRHRKENSSTRRSAATARAVGRPENPGGGATSNARPFKGEGLASIPAKIWGGGLPFGPTVPTAMYIVGVALP